jgi:membrane protein implicated in regulation of membrane protease activity
MWLVYLLALVLGGGTLLVQMLSGLGHGHDFFGDGHHPLHGPGLMSTRSVTFGLLDFGLVGGALHFFGILSPAWALTVGALAGVATSLVVSLAFRQLDHPDASGAAMFEEARGRTARVLVACAPGQRGKVRVELKGQTVDMLATADAASVPEGAQVRIVDVRGDVAHVEAMTG